MSHQKTTDQVSDRYVEEARIHSMKGDALQKIGCYTDAIECINMVIALDPKSDGAYVRKGSVLTEQGRSMMMMFKLSPTTISALINV